ncbi:hypothetical protein BLNAU_12843 [Blattamonas nauphoetae]|uniref:Uncharacterized protein n=1 Tax=Blattamonas nauphoetae TaxID=2049346 RepID=A0ABQ9XNB5_9EUKA|nr:hypothetical protein BLNAU_12843 [Blattamonas nauphoetae]
MEADRTAQLMPLKSKRDLVSSERTEGLHLSPKVSRSRSVDLEDSPSMNYMRTLDILSISRSDLTKMKFGDCAEDGWGDGNENENGMGNGADVSVSNDVCEIGSHSTNDVLPTLGKDEEGWSGAETGPKLFSERTVQFVVPSLSEEARIASAEVGHLKPEFAVLPNFFSQSSPEMGQNSLGTDISKSTSMSEPLLDVGMRTTRDAAEQLPPAPSILTTPPTKMSSEASGGDGGTSLAAEGRATWREKGGESEGQVVSFTKVEVEKEDDEAVNELMKMIGLWREWLEKKKGVSLVDLVVSSQEECGRRIEVDVARSKRRLRRQQRKQNRSRSSRRTQRASVVPRVPLNDLSRGLELLLTELEEETPQAKSRKKKACFIDIAEVAFQSEIDGIHQNQNRADFQLGVDLGRVLRNVILVETAEQETENNEVGHSSSSIVVHCTLTVSALVLPLFCHVSFGNIVVSLQNCMMTTDEHSTSALSLALTVQGVEVSASRADHHIPIFSVEKNVHSSLTPPQPKDPSSGPSFNQPHLSLVQTNPRLAATPICFILAKQDRTDRRSGVLQKHLLLSGLIKYVELLFLPAGQPPPQTTPELPTKMHLEFWADESLVVVDPQNQYALELTRKGWETWNRNQHRTRTQHESSSVASMIQNAIAPRLSLWSSQTQLGSSPSLCEMKSEEKTHALNIDYS